MNVLEDTTTKAVLENSIFLFLVTNFWNCVALPRSFLTLHQKFIQFFWILLFAVLVWFLKVASQVLAFFEHAF